MESVDSSACAEDKGGAEQLQDGGDGSACFKSGAVSVSNAMVVWMVN